jgi:hypothetical protein
VRSIRYILILLLTVPCCLLEAQIKFSLATDLSLLRNFDGKQKFTVIGQSVIPQWHIDKKTTVYDRFTYHANGKYKSDLSAYAKSPSTTPQSFAFANNSEMKLRQFSFGVKKYFIGTYDNLSDFNIYGAAGFGLIFGNASNNFSTVVDTALYTVQNNVVNGSGDFKRLTFDITGGFEIPVSYEFYIYSEARMHIPTTSYPNNYLLKNSKAPFLATLNLGLRILFNADP